jgi:autotransporter-associated beta strand protein
MKFTLRLLLAGLLPFSTLFAGSATWNLVPISNDWNTARNWTPRTIPNSPTDIATFSTSNIYNPVIHSSVEVNSIVFNGDFTQFTVTAGDATSQNTATLTLSGAGVLNTSTVLLQALQAAPTMAISGATNVISFSNSATLAGSAFSFLTALGGGSTGLAGGEIKFFNSSSAGAAALEADKGQDGGGPGRVSFFDNSAAGDSQIINIAGDAGTTPGVTTFDDASSAGTATVNNDGAGAAGVAGGTTFFLGSSTAADSLIFASSGVVDNAGGGTVIFSDMSSAGNAILNVDSGSNGVLPPGSVQFLADSTGATAVLFGIGDLMIGDHNPPGITIGSIEGGGGNVFLGSNELTVGSANLSTTYRGVIQGSGSFTKTGTGLLRLKGSNTYTGSTTIEGGELMVNNTSGSGTGSGAVQVNGGILAGLGTIAGNVTIGPSGGSHALLEPGSVATVPQTLTILGRLTFNSGGVFKCGVNSSSATADKVVSNGVKINVAARFSLTGGGNTTLPPGMVLTVISNTGVAPIAGTFGNLADGAIVAFGGNTFQANYEGGDGNDLTLTVQ